MIRLIVLDSGVLSLLTHPRPGAESQACSAWVESLLAAGDLVVVPEITDYEVRREYLRRGSTQALSRLDLLAQQLGYAQLTTPIMRRAAELWAWARGHGHVTAPNTDLDADVILAAQAQLLALPGILIVIATTNVRHLAPFVDAKLWREI